MKKFIVVSTLIALGALILSTAGATPLLGLALLTLGVLCAFADAEGLALYV